MDEERGFTLSERDEDILVRFIGAVDGCLPQVPLLTREGWAIAACAVTTAGMLSTKWNELWGDAKEREDMSFLPSDRDSEIRLRQGIKKAADVYCQMSATMTGTMPSNADAMRELLDSPQKSVAKITTRSVQLRALGKYDPAAANAKLSQILPQGLTLEIMDGNTPALLRLRGTLAQVCPGAGFEVDDVDRSRADEKVPNAPEAGARKDHEKGSKTMDENSATTTGAQQAEPIYAHVKISPSDVKLTGKTSVTKAGKTVHNAFVNLPQGTNVNDVDLTGYQIFTKLADFQHDKVHDREPITLRFNEKYPVEVFRGFDDAGQRVDPLKVDPWKFCSAVKAATAAREANKENYARIIVGREDVHPYTKTNPETGEQTEMARVTLPEGTLAPSGEDISGRNVFMRMSKFNTKDFEAGRGNISFSVFKDSEIRVTTDKELGEFQETRVTAHDLAEAVRGAREQSAKEEHTEDHGCSLEELESAARAGSQLSTGEPESRGEAR